MIYPPIKEAFTQKADVISFFYEKEKKRRKSRRYDKTKRKS